MTNFHNLVNPHTTIKDSGLCHFKDMDKTILIFKDINCFGSIAYGIVCRYFVRILKFASHCRCTKLSVQSGDAELQSEIVAKLVPGSGGTQLAIFHPRPGPGGSCCTQWLGIRKVRSPGRGQLCTAHPAARPVRVTTCDFIAEFETAEARTCFNGD